MPAGRLAAAEEHVLRGARFVGHRGKNRAAVRAVAERLLLAAPAGAPEVLLSGLDGNLDGRLLGWNQGRHEAFLLLRSEAHTSELQSLMRISYALFCLNKKKHSA